MRVYLQQLGLSLFASRSGALLFAASVGAYIPLRRYYGYTDALTNFFILLALILAAKRLHLATALALGVGTVAKESMLLLVPFLARRLIVPPGSWWTAATVVAPPVAVFIALRLFVPPDPSGSAPVALTLSAQFDYWRTAMVHGAPRWVLWAFAYSLGPVWLLAAAAIRGNMPFIATMVLYAIPVLVPLTRTTDTERALMLLFPIAFPLAAHAIDRCDGNSRALWITALAVACTWVAQLTFDWIPQQRVGPVNAKDVTFLLLCLAPAAAVLRCQWGNSQEHCALRWPSQQP
jgi:hypothetical protein